MVLYNIVKNVRNDIDGDIDGNSLIDDTVDTINAIGYYANLANKTNEEIDAANHIRDFCRIINRSIDQCQDH